MFSSFLLILIITFNASVGEYQSFFLFYWVKSNLGTSRTIFNTFGSLRCGTMFAGLF